MLIRNAYSFIHILENAIASTSRARPTYLRVVIATQYHERTRLFSTFPRQNNTAASIKPLPIDVKQTPKHSEFSEFSRTSTENLTSAQQTAYDRLRPVIDTFDAPVDWAVAYGSGVIHQANASPDQPAPLTDLLLSTPSTSTFHTTNLAQNPSHYPLLARLLGGSRIGWLTDHWGAGVWYVTMVKVQDIEIKYGVISTERLKADLEDWETLYLAGRLQKPVLPLKSPSHLQSSQETNLKSALTLSLLILSNQHPFTERELYEQITGISYSGDPRMSVPGAENPDKVKNIVSGPGNLEGFRRIYGGLNREVKGLRWVDEKGSGSGKMEGKGEAGMIFESTPEEVAQMVKTLPKNLRDRLPPDVLDGSRTKELAPVLNKHLADIIRRPATTQSIKGLFTAGLTKSVWYSLAKFRKWFRSRRR